MEIQLVLEHFHFSKVLSSTMWFLSWERNKYDGIHYNGYLPSNSEIDFIIERLNYLKNTETEESRLKFNTEQEQELIDLNNRK